MPVRPAASPPTPAFSSASMERDLAAPGGLTLPRILIVDDISDNRAILTRRLERRGFEIMEADSGLQALDLIDSQSFDMVLLDVMMPGIDGLETLRRIRQHWTRTTLPVIMITAKAEGENVVEAIELGANDYVTKPVFFPTVLARIEAELSRRKTELELVQSNQRLKVEIANREESEVRSHYLANRDLLTGLSNRPLFKQQLADALNDGSAAQQSFAVLLIDLDGFQAINDDLGHSVGDLLLKSTAKRLRDILPPSDRIARLGGDKFAVLQVAATQPATSIALADKIINVIGQPCAIEGHVVSVGASVGIATGNAGAVGSETLLKSAELAMYVAKSEGRGRYRLFDPEMDAMAQLRRVLERDLRTALIHSGFRLFYQPIVNLQSNAVVAFEALMRWQHPERGLVPPAEFIEMAEEMGLIVQIGEWSLRQACKEAMNWRDDIRVSVNLSPLQFTKSNMVATVANALASAGLPASRLELEISEAVLLDTSDANLAMLDQLRKLGIRISIDNFGAGSTSIASLSSLKVDKIKIDQSFIRDLLDNEGSLAIVRTIIGLGKKFGMTISAEGVETREQVERLRLEGCVEVQGYLYSRPVPADEIAAVLDSI